MRQRAEDRSRILSGIGLTLMIATSLIVAVRIGTTPAAKMGFFLVGCLIWYTVLGWLKELVGK